MLSPSVCVLDDNMRCGVTAVCVGYKYHQRTLGRLSLPHMGESSSWCCSVSPGRQPAAQALIICWNLWPQSSDPWMRRTISRFMCNCIIYSLIFSLAHMSCSIKSWKCMLMWHWQFQNLNESCAAISYVHHLIRFHLSRFLLNPNVRMCSLHWALCCVQCMCWQEFADNNLQISTH